MPNKTQITKKVVPFAATVAANSVIVANVNTQYNKEFEGGAGQSFQIQTFGTGTVYDGLTSSTSDIKGDAVTVTLQSKGIEVGYSVLEKAYDIGEKNLDIVMDMNAIKLATNIEKDFASAITGDFGAGVVVGDSTAAGFDGLSVLGDAVATLDLAKAPSTNVGILNSDAMNRIATGSQKAYFEAIEGAYAKGTIGKYRNATWAMTANMPRFVATAVATGVLATAVADPGVDGDEKQIPIATIPCAALGAAPTPGTIFHIAGVFAVDGLEYNSTGRLFPFVVQAGSTTTSLKVQPIYVAGPLKNVSTATIPNAAITSPLTAGATYAVGAVWDKTAISGGFQNLKPVTDGGETSQVKRDQIALTMHIYGNGNTMTDKCRWDALYFKKVLRDSWNVGVFIRV